MSDTPMGRIVGKWPGDETEEQITEALEQLGKCQECRKLEDLLRWRLWPEEKPNESGWFLCNFGKTDDCEDIVAVHFDLEGDRLGKWPLLAISHWRPIGPLPGEGGE